MKYEDVKISRILIESNVMGVKELENLDSVVLFGVQSGEVVMGALVQFASVSDGELETMPNLTPYPLEIEGEVCGQSIEEAVYKLLDRLNGKEAGDADADGRE